MVASGQHCSWSAWTADAGTLYSRKRLMTELLIVAALFCTDDFQDIIVAAALDHVF
mgnify:CR=1 FL=1